MAVPATPIRWTRMAGDSTGVRCGGSASGALPRPGGRPLYYPFGSRAEPGRDAEVTAMKAVAPAEQRVVLDKVSWSTFVTLLSEADNRRGRMTYDQGVLEIMSPSMRHENAKKLLGRLLEAA